MSRIGRQPVAIPKGVQVTAQNGSVKVKGPKGELSMSLVSGVSLAVSETEAVVKLERDDKEANAVYGLTRAILANLVHGVGTGFQKSLEIQGTGYRAALEARGSCCSSAIRIRSCFPCRTACRSKWIRPPSSR